MTATSNVELTLCTYKLSNRKLIRQITRKKILNARKIIWNIRKIVTKELQILVNKNKLQN